MADTFIDNERYLASLANQLCEDNGCHEYVVKFGKQTFNKAIQEGALITQTNVTTIAPKVSVKKISGPPAVFHGTNKLLKKSSGQQAQIMVYTIEKIPRDFVVGTITGGYALTSLLPAITNPKERAVILLSGPDLGDDTPFEVTDYTLTSVVNNLTVQSIPEYASAP